MARLANARNNHMTRWVIPVAKRLLIEEACKNAPTRPLGEVAHIEMGQSPVGDSCNDDGEGVPLIGGPADLGIEFPQTTRWTTSPTKVCRSEDIIVCVRATIGEPRWADGIYCLGRGVAGIRPIDKSLLPKFLFFIIEGNEQFLQSKGTGTTFKTISKEHLASIQVPMIPSEEQMIIVTFLVWLEQNSRTRPNFLDAPPLPASLVNQSRIIARIAELAARIEEARGLRREAVEKAEITLSEAVTRILNDKQWTYFTLGSLLRENSRNGLSAYPSDSPPGIPILRISAATSRPDAIIDEHDYKYIELDERDIIKYKLEPGDLLACRFNGNLHYVGKFALYTGYLGKTQVYPDKLIRFRLDTEKVSPEFARYAINSPTVRKSIETFCATTAGNIGVSASDLKLVTMPVPPLSEQRHMVDCLDNIQSKVDSLKQLQSETSAELDALLPSILDKSLSENL